MGRQNCLARLAYRRTIIHFAARNMMEQDRLEVETTSNGSILRVMRRLPVQFLFRQVYWVGSSCNDLIFDEFSVIAFSRGAFVFFLHVTATGVLICTHQYALESTY